MTPEALARLHERANNRLRVWTAAEFQALLGDRHCILCDLPHAFALGRAVADEAELLTLATDPDHRRAGLGRTCLAAFESAAFQRGARVAFLEVDAENAAALGLYRSSGYTVAARRAGYYRLRDGRRADALILRKRLA